MNYPLNETGKRIQNYVFNFSDFLGAGNFSKCYKGFNELTREIVAIKIIELNSLKSKKLQELLFQQIEILKKLNHPSVLKCYQIFTSNRNCYIITELCNQGNLQNQLKLKKTFDQPQANHIIKDVYEGLLYLAQNNIVHRDLKSANIFLHNGRAKIADFGFAKQINHNFKDLNIGSPLYMAPEGILHNVYGPKTEVWALGILVYELFHGSSPYIYCKTQEELKRSVSIPLNWNQLRADLSQDIKQFILTCLQINEQKRSTIQQLMNSGYMRRLNYVERQNSLSMREFRSSSKSVHLINNQQSMRNIQSQHQQSQEKVNSSFRQQNIVFVHSTQRNKTLERVGFKSMDIRSNQKHNTFDFVSPRKPPILSHPIKHEYNTSPSRVQSMLTSLRPPSINFPNQKHPQMINLISQSVNLPTFDHSHSFQAIDNTLVPASQYLNEIKNVNYPIQRNNSLQKTSFNTMGYNSMNGLYNFSGGANSDANENSFVIQSQPVHQPQPQLQLLPPPPQDHNDNTQPISTSWIFHSKLNFKQAIFFIHHCRLIFKFLYLYKETVYFNEQKYLRIFKYLMSLLIELNRLSESGDIKADGEKAMLKIRKFKQVNAEYMVKYQKQLDDNKYTLVAESITLQTFNATNLALKQIFTRLNSQISSLCKTNYLSSTSQNLIILGHLCITIMGSLKQIQSCISKGNFKKILQFKQIQTVLNTKMEDFTMVSYKRYLEMFVGVIG